MSCVEVLEKVGAQQAGVAPGHGCTDGTHHLGAVVAMPRVAVFDHGFAVEVGMRAVWALERGAIGTWPVRKQ